MVAPTDDSVVLLGARVCDPAGSAKSRDRNKTTPVPQWAMGSIEKKKPRSLGAAAAQQQGRAGKRNQQLKSD